MMPFTPNRGKNLEIETDAGVFYRYPVKTHVVMAGDNLFAMMDQYVKEYLRDGDMIFISEKIVAISQGRAFPVDEIKPSRLARLLCKFVVKTPYGIGLGIPETMELAIREVDVFESCSRPFARRLPSPLAFEACFIAFAGTRPARLTAPVTARCRRIIIMRKWRLKSLTGWPGS